MAPAVEPVVDHGGGSVSGRAVLPAGTDPQDMNDPADDAPVIHPPRPRLVLRQKRLDRRPSPVRKLKCLIPAFGGAIFSLEWKEALWDRFFMAAPQRQRQSVRCPAGDCAAIAERGAIQNSEESLRALSARYGVNQKTVAKWRKRTSVADLPTGPKDAKSTVLTLDEEAIIVAFRRHTLLPLEFERETNDPGDRL